MGYDGRLGGGLIRHPHSAVKFLPGRSPLILSALITVSCSANRIVVYNTLRITDRLSIFKLSPVQMDLSGHQDRETVDMVVDHLFDILSTLLKA